MAIWEAIIRRLGQTVLETISLLSEEGSAYLLILRTLIRPMSTRAVRDSMTIMPTRDVCHVGTVSMIRGSMELITGDHGTTHGMIHGIMVTADGMVPTTRGIMDMQAGTIPGITDMEAGMDGVILIMATAMAGDILITADITMPARHVAQPDGVAGVAPAQTTGMPAMAIVAAAQPTMGTTREEQPHAAVAIARLAVAATILQIPQCNAVLFSVLPRAQQVVMGEADTAVECRQEDLAEDTQFLQAEDTLETGAGKA